MENISGTYSVIGLMKEIKQEFDKSLSLLSLRLLNNLDFDIPKDIVQIQHLQDIIVQDLHNVKSCLNRHLSIVEKTDLIMNILNYKVYELQYLFRSKFDELKTVKENLIQRSNKEYDDHLSKIALEIVQIEDDINELQETHQHELSSINEQKIDAQKAYERAIALMDENFDKLRNGLDKLLVLIEAEKSTLNESQTELINGKFADEIQQFQNDIDQFTELQTIGWRIIYPDEKISGLLQEQGFKILHSGQLVDKDGHVISYAEAKSSGIFDHFHHDSLEKLEEAMKIDERQSSTDSSEKSDSILSKLSSEDVDYLKEVLGKPLTLALAEIAMIQPKDPVHYLAHWLFKYRYNLQMDDFNSNEYDQLNAKRLEVAKERWHKFIEEEAKAAVIEMILRTEEIVMLNELQRQEEEEECDNNILGTPTIDNN